MKVIYDMCVRDRYRVDMGCYLIGIDNIRCDRDIDGDAT